MNNRQCNYRITKYAARSHKGLHKKTQPAFHLSLDSRNTPATSSQNAFHHSVTTCQLQSLSLSCDALTYTNCAAARDAKQPCQKYNTGEKHNQMCSTPTQSTGISVNACNNYSRKSTHASKFVVSQLLAASTCNN